MVKATGLDNRYILQLQNRNHIIVFYTYVCARTREICMICVISVTPPNEQQERQERAACACMDEVSQYVGRVRWSAAERRCEEEENRTII